VDSIEEIVAANRLDAARYRAPAGPHRPRLALVACMDARIDPWQAFGLKQGSTHVIRNAGGRLADAIRSIAISQVMLDTDAVAIVHHTDCGLLTFSDETMRARLREERGAIADDIAFLPFADQEKALRDDLALYRQTPFLRQDIPVRAFVYDLKTGALREVV